MKANKTQRTDFPMVIGLTGSSGAGKSTVSEYLRARGALVLDADSISHELTAKGGAALEAIKHSFGDAVFFDDGMLNRRVLASLVFNDASKLEMLNAIIHPMVIERMQELSREHMANAHGEIIFWDVPLLIESGMHKYTNEVWLVVAPDALRLERIMQRDGITGAEALARVDAQMSQTDKAEFATVIIDNESDVASLHRRLDALCRALREKYGERVFCG